MGASQIIYIRTDGNKDIAAGHIMRCLTIAREIVTMGHSVCFLVSDEESLSILCKQESSVVIASDMQTYEDSIDKNNIYAYELSHADYRDLERELPELLSLLQKYPGTLLIDSYYVTDNYLKALQAITGTAYIDDIRAFAYTADLLINYDCFTEKMCTKHKHGIYKNIPNLLLGAEYAPLRPQFLENKISVSPNVHNIFITTGSSDPYHFSLLFCKHLLEKCTSTGYDYHIVIGSLNTDFETIKNLVQDCPNIHLYRGLTDLMSLMLTCDLAITAGGTTLYELCALGIPSFSFSMADNQHSNPMILDELGIVPYGGDIRTDMDTVLKQCFTFISDFSNDYEKRKAAHTKMNSLITGDGAKKIANAILAL